MSLTRDVCGRNPWGLRRMLSRHGGETGVVVYGWFNRVRGWVPRGDWEAVVVNVDGRQRAVLDQLHRGPAWISVEPGDRAVEFFGGRRRLQVVRLVIANGVVVLIMFRPPNRWPVRSLSAERWCVRRVSA